MISAASAWLVAQALCEGAALVTVDELLTRYGATVLWAGS